MKRRIVQNYKKNYGKTQQEMVALYMSLNKEIDEIQELLKAPRASIRGRISEIKAVKPSFLSGTRY